MPLPQLPRARTAGARSAAVLGALALGLLPGAPYGAVAHAAPSSVDGAAQRTLLVLDSSGSMAEPAAGGTTKIEAARTALGQIVDGLPQDAEVGMRVYGATVDTGPGSCEDSQLTVPVGTDNRDDLREAVSAYEPLGETPIGYALEQAATDLGPDGPRSIVLVSDGEATCDPDPCQVAATLAEQGVDLRIDVVGLDVDDVARNQLRCIAAASGGSYIDADSADEIVEGLATATERALRPFGLEGTPTTGGPDHEGATEVTAGAWVDEVDGGASEERWFRYERTMEDSTVIVGVSTLGRSGARNDYVELQAFAPDGTTSCGNASALKQLNAGGLLGVEVAAGPDSSVGREECHGDDLLLRVSRDFSTITQGVASYRLHVVEEPAPTNAAELLPRQASFETDHRDAEVTGDVVPVTAGASFGSATELTTGRWSSTAVPGETQVFRVWLEAGQSLSARLTTPPASASLVASVGASGPFADLQVHSPVGAGYLRTVGASPSGTASDEAGTQLATSTAPVRYVNRSVNGSGSGPVIAGWHYLVYGVDRVSTSGGFELPYTLDVQVVGEPAGAPTYAAGEEVIGLDTLGVPPEGPDSGDGAGDEDGGDPSPSTEDADGTGDSDGGLGGTQVAVAGALAVVAVGAGVGGVLLLRRSRT